MTNIIIVISLELLFSIAFIYWTVNISYSKRFIPTIILLLLAISVFVIPQILSHFDVIKMGLSLAVIVVFFSIPLALGLIVNLIVALFIKRK
jgi:hypothetical protein